MLRWKTLIPAVLLTVGITIVSLIENPHLPAEMAMRDKLLHGFMYTLLTISWIVPLTREPSPITSNRLQLYVLVFLSVTAFGALLEVLQRFCTLTRSGEMADVLADGVGAIIGIILVIVCRRLFTTSH